MFRRSAVLAAMALAILVVFLAPSAPAAVPTVDVEVPVGLSSDFPTTSLAKNGDLYVTVPSLRVPNPNTAEYGPYDPHDFHLLAGGHVYYPVVRPGLAALDLSSSGIVRPGAVLVTTVSFEVPAATTKALLEFVPHWFGDNGASVAFCCYYI